MKILTVIMLAAIIHTSDHTLPVSFCCGLFMLYIVVTSQGSLATRVSTNIPSNGIQIEAIIPEPGIMVSG